MATLDDVVSNLLSIAKNIGSLIGVLQTTLPRVTGTFTMGAAPTTVVTEPAVLSNSIITLQPTNASAGTLMGSAKSPYVSAKSVGVSFTVATASGAAAAGTETFLYTLFTPG